MSFYVMSYFALHHLTDVYGVFQSLGVGRYRGSFYPHHSTQRAQFFIWINWKAQQWEAIPLASIRDHATIDSVNLTLIYFYIWVNWRSQQRELIHLAQSNRARVSDFTIGSVKPTLTYLYIWTD